jgi:hypothetical protein
VRALVLAAIITAIAVIVFGVFSPVDVVRIYVLGITALVGAAVAGRTLSRFSRLERASRKAERVDAAERPVFFDRAIRRVELANASGVYFEQLRPRLREIAEQRLASHGLRLHSAEARELLGEGAWRALDRPPERDKFAPPPEGELAGVITALERI